MYARIENQQIAEYPLTEHDIRSLFPNTSFTTNFAAGLPDGFVRVLDGSRPAPNDLQEVEEVAPTLVNGEWIRQYAIKDKYTQQEAQNLAEKVVQQKWTDLRNRRNDLLEETRWIVERHIEQKTAGAVTTLNDGEFQLWLAYRQQLRDLPATTTDINNIQWPSAPGTLGIVGI